MRRQARVREGKARSAEVCRYALVVAAVTTVATIKTRNSSSVAEQSNP